LLLTVWYDILDEKLAKALQDRASFRCYSGFATH
jgi:IS5 family transposase